MKIGTMLHHRYFNGVAGGKEAEEYRTKVTEYFQNFGMRGSGIIKMVLPEEPGKHPYRWETVDKMIVFCNQNNLDIHYNSVLASNLESYPEWYLNLSESERLKALERHVRSVVARYRGKVSFFKLVNEPLLGENDNYLGTGMKSRLLIAKIFEWARDEYSDGLYMLNEHGAIFRDEKREKLIDLFKSLKSKELVDILGLEGHMGYWPRYFALPEEGDISSALTEIREAVELPIYITEFDLSWNNNVHSDNPHTKIDPTKPIEIDGISYPTWFDYQAFAYSKFIDICKNLGFIDHLYFWSFNDRDSWERPDTGLFTPELSIRKGFEEVLEKVMEAGD
jgi:GH35 family endo-1,4-beta-xylanase